MKEDGIVMPKKICFLTTLPCTIEAFVFPLAEYLHTHTDWEITFITGMDEDYVKPLPEGVKVLRVHMHRGMSFDGLRAIRELVAVFRREKFDLVQYSTPNAALYASIAAKLVGVPVRLYCQWGIVYVGFHGFKRVVFKLIEKFICRLSTWVEPDSFGNLHFSRAEGLYPKSKGSVIWNGSACGVNLNKFDISRRSGWRQAIRERYGIPTDALVFGFIGRITGDKGINELFSAYQKILKEFPNSFLMLVGGMEKADSVDNHLYAWAEEEPRVLFCGSTNVVEQYLAAMDVFILPSYREGFGAVVVEAEAMGLPVIVTDIPGPTDAMREGETGLIVKKADIVTLVDAMRRLGNDKELCAMFSSNARLFIENSFEQSKLMQYILEDRKRLMGIAE